MHRWDLNLGMSRRRLFILQVWTLGLAGLFIWPEKPVQGAVHYLSLSSNSFLSPPEKKASSRSPSLRDISLRRAKTLFWSKPVQKTPQEIYSFKTDLTSGLFPESLFADSILFGFDPFYSLFGPRPTSFEEMMTAEKQLPRTLSGGVLPDRKATAALDALQGAAKAFKKEDYKQAIEMAQKSLVDDPINAKSHFMLGTALLALKRNEEAQKALIISLNIDPQNPQALSNLAILRYREDKPEEALRILIQALEQDIEFIDAWKNYLSMLSKKLLPLGTPPPRMLRLKPPTNGERDQVSPSVWHWKKAIQAMNANQSQQATEHFINSLILNINDANVHNDFAIYLMRLNHQLLALPFLRAASHLAPNAPLVKKNLEELILNLNAEAAKNRTGAVTGAK